MRLIFMVEERSMKELLEMILPQIVPGVETLVISHNGKSDLRQSIPRKLRAWQCSDDKFIIVHDQDSHDCKVLKKELQTLCDEHRKNCVVRIVCHELEAWYFGDLEAVAAAYGKPNLFVKYGNNKKYRIPDAIGNAKEELRKLIPELQQISGATRIGSQMDIGRNTSHSFKTFVSGVKKIVEGGK
ncbi:MAG: DUF4276 family protein [Thermoguttaceae bacterium]